jgi:hypothetical protein
MAATAIANGIPGRQRTMLIVTPWRMSVDRDLAAPLEDVTPNGDHLMPTNMESGPASGWA